MDELARALARAAEGMPPTVVMEVCGTHTNAVARYALKQLLPDNMRLVSGPGCPVCVTDGGTIEAALYLVRRCGATVLSFGDMLRVPSQSGESLWSMREDGRDVRIAVSPLDALLAAQREPEKEFVWFAVGFETTAPLTAAMLARARAAGVRNLTVLSAQRTMPAALKSLLMGNGRVQALLCPGHVAAITGADAFRFVPDVLGLPGAISGFGPEEILSALLWIALMRRDGRTELVNAYPAAVTAGGNEAALHIMDEVFEPCAARWRGLGEIEGSGLKLRGAYSDFDALKRFSAPAFDLREEAPGCLCAAILRAEAGPEDCPLFGRECTPDAPAGPCMVSSEGACAAVYRYGGR